MFSNERAQHGLSASRFLLLGLLAVLAVGVSGCRLLQNDINLKYWESGIWPAKKGNVIIKHKASSQIAVYYRDFCQDIPDMLTKGRCIALPILESIKGNDQGALIVEASVENAAGGDVVDAQDIVTAIEDALIRPGRQCFHIRADGFSSNPLNWSWRDYGNDNCDDGLNWDYPGFTDTTCTGCIPAPNYSFKHFASLTPQPGNRPTNSCVKAADVYQCRLVTPDAQGNAYLVPDNREFGGAASTVSTATYMGSAYGYSVKKKNGATFEGCKHVNIGYQNYQYQCAYKTKNQWVRKVSDSTWRIYFDAAQSTWKSVSCGLELGKVLKNDPTSNPQKIAQKCGEIPW